MELFKNTPLVLDYLKDRHQSHEIENLTIDEHFKTNVYVKYTVGDAEWDTRNLVISMWDLMAFLYSKIESYKVETAPITPIISLRVSGEDLKEMLDNEVMEEYITSESSKKPRLNSDLFLKKWRKFRACTNPNLSTQEQEKMLEFLSDYSEKQAVEMLEQSIANKWLCLYPVPKESPN